MNSDINPSPEPLPVPSPPPSSSSLTPAPAPVPAPIASAAADAAAAPRDLSPSPPPPPPPPLPPFNIMPNRRQRGTPGLVIIDAHRRDGAVEILRGLFANDLLEDLVVVTGGTSRVGRELLPRLGGVASRTTWVVVFVRDTNTVFPSITNTIYYQGDPTSWSGIISQILGISGGVSVSYISLIWDSDDPYRGNNIEGSVRRVLVPRLRAMVLVTSTSSLIRRATVPLFIQSHEEYRHERFASARQLHREVGGFRLLVITVGHIYGLRSTSNNIFGVTVGSLSAAPFSLLFNTLHIGNGSSAQEVAKGILALYQSDEDIIYGRRSHSRGWIP